MVGTPYIRSFYNSDEVPESANVEFSWEFIQCKGCKTISFKQYYIDEEGVEQNVKYFPEPVKRKIKEIYGLDDDLKVLYQNSIVAFNMGMNILCAAGLRAIVEGLYVKEKVREKLDKQGQIDGHDYHEELPTRNLFGKIEAMGFTQIISKDSSSTLHSIRFLGNEALHELRRPEEKDIILAIEILENILENKYQIPRLSQELSNRREKSNKR